VEVVYLVEKSRLPEIALERLCRALADPEAVLATAPLDLAIAQMVRHIPRNVVPDMPDRIIAATALQLNLPLITRDRDIRATGIETIW
jgi:predicted nucleic acid-binding protein